MVQMAPAVDQQSPKNGVSTVDELLVEIDNMSKKDQEDTGQPAASSAAAASSGSALDEQDSKNGVNLSAATTTTAANADDALFKVDDMVNKNLAQIVDVDKPPASTDNLVSNNDVINVDEQLFVSEVEKSVKPPAVPPASTNPVVDNSMKNDVIVLDEPSEVKDDVNLKKNENNNQSTIAVDSQTPKNIDVTIVETPEKKEEPNTQNALTVVGNKTSKNELAVVTEQSPKVIDLTKNEQETAKSVVEQAPKNDAPPVVKEQPPATEQLEKTDNSDKKPQEATHTKLPTTASVPAQPMQVDPPVVQSQPVQTQSKNEKTEPDSSSRNAPMVDVEKTKENVPTPQDTPKDVEKKVESSDQNAPMTDVKNTENAPISEITPKHSVNNQNVPVIETGNSTKTPQTDVEMTPKPSETSVKPTPAVEEIDAQPASQTNTVVPPKRGGNSVVAMTPFSIDPRSYSRSQQTPRKRPAPSSSPDPSNMFTPPPRGRAPLDSLGDSMTWDGTAGLWRSNRNANETKISKAVLRRRTSISSQTEERTPKAPRAKTTQSTPMEITPAEPTPPAPAPVAAPATTSAVTSTTPAADQEEAIVRRPGGRPPHDSSGRAMEWDFKVGIWRSLHVEGETKHPKSTPKTVVASAAVESEPAPSPTPAPVTASQAKPIEKESKNGETKLLKEEEEILEEGKEEDESDKPQVTMTMRPGGRAPNDSTGTGMVWDGVQAVWRSLKVAEETRKPNVQVWKYSGGPTVDANDRPVELVEQVEEAESSGSGVKTPRKKERSDGDEAAATPRPRGKPPNDSVGQVMQWDGINAVWISSHVEGETRTPKAKTPKVDRVRRVVETPVVEAKPTPSPVVEKVVDVQNVAGDTTMTKKTEIEKKSEPAEGNTKAPEEDVVMEEEEITADDKNTTKKEITKEVEAKAEEAKTPNKTEEEADASDIKTPSKKPEVEEVKDAPATPRPRGKPPNDSVGQVMQWDGINAVWISSHVEGETRTPKAKVPKPGDDRNERTPQNAQQQLEQQRVESTMRPKGRAPHDKQGKPMVWDVGHHCWRSTTDLSETKAPKAEAASAAAASAGAESEAGPSSKGITRPKGRAPFDSTGVSMTWDAEEGVWRSSNDPNEVKTPKKITS